MDRKTFLGRLAGAVATLLLPGRAVSQVAATPAVVSTGELVTNTAALNKVWRKVQSEMMVPIKINGQSFSLPVYGGDPDWSGTMEGKRLRPRIDPWDRWENEQWDLQHGRVRALGLDPKRLPG